MKTRAALKATKFCDIHNKPKTKITDWDGDDVYLCENCWHEKGLFSGKKPKKKK